MGNTEAAKQTEQPLLGQAALTAAMADLAAAAKATVTTQGAAGGTAGAAVAEPAPKTISQLLGEITWLMTQSPRHKQIPIGDLEWLVMPAILLKQFRMFYNGEQPVGVAVWAMADDIVAKRIDGGEKRLTAVEWKSGPNMRIVELVAPFGGEAEMRGQVGSISI